jgi:acetyl esterase/lipase
MSSSPSQWLDLQYGPHALHSFHLLCPDNASQTTPLLVFVHGGAWGRFLPCSSDKVSPSHPSRSGDKNDLLPFAHRILELGACSVALINYRLTSPSNRLQHPAHCDDVLQAIEFLHSPTEDAPYAAYYDAKQLHLAGHSCGAHILATLFMDHTDAFPYASRLPDDALIPHIRSISCSEGLFDLDLLIQNFPSYRRWFLASAFGDQQDYRAVSPVHYSLREGSSVRWLILHSTGDRLVDLVQSEAFFAKLTDLGVSPEKDWESLEGDHDQILDTAAYALAIHTFVLRESQVLATSSKA